MEKAEQEALEAAVRRIRPRVGKYRARKGKLGEENTKVTLISPLLRSLGWDIEDPNEVEHEYRHASQDSPVDYALFIEGKPELFVEAKGIDECLEDRRWTTQMLTYATSAGVNWCVLTNGDEYRIYNAHARAPVEEKLLCAVRVSDTSHHGALITTLGLLSKESTRNALLDEYWETTFVDRQVREILRDLLDKADNSLLRLVRKRSQGLSPRQVSLSLARLRPRLDFAEQFPALQPPSSPEPKGRPRGTGGKRKRQPLVPGLPTQTSLEVPLLRWLLSRGGEVDIRRAARELDDGLADEFNVPETLRRIRFEGRAETVWSNRIRWTRMRLVQKGEMDGSRRGIWAVTDMGRQRVNAGAESR